MEIILNLSEKQIQILKVTDEKNNYRKSIQLYLVPHEIIERIAWTQGSRKRKGKDISIHPLVFL